MKMIINNFFNRQRRWLLLYLLWVVMALPPTVLAEQITMRDFTLYEQEEGKKENLVATIRFDYQLTEYLRESLLNGITLRNEIRFDLVWHSDWWWNKTENFANIVSELRYNALTGQYQLVNKNSNANWNFSNLTAALKQLGSVEKYQLPALPDSAFSGDAALYIETTLEPRASKSLGVPAQLSSLFSKEQRELTSQGILWPLTP